MASIVFGSLGGAVGGPVGAAALGAVGSLIDSKLLYPALFPAESLKPGRIPEASVGNFTEGSPVQRVYGKVRVPCQLLWAGELKRKIVSEGGGTKTPTSQREIFFRSLLYGAAETSIRIQGGISFIKLYADGKVLYDGELDDVLSVTRTDFRLDTFNTRGALLSLNIETPNDDFDFQAAGFRTGFILEVIGSANGFDGLYKVSRVQQFKLRLASLERNKQAGPDEIGTEITIQQEGLPKFDIDKLDEEPTFYPGTLSQPPDPLVEAEEGTGNVEANRRIANFSLENLQLRFFGNRPPQLEALVKAGGGLTVGDVIAMECERVGLQSIGDMLGEPGVDVDATACTEKINGYVIPGPTSAADAISPLLLVYDLFEQERDGKIFFVPRKDVTPIVIATEDLGVAEEGGEPEAGPRLSDDLRIQAPTQLDFTYFDSENDYLPSTLSDKIDQEDENRSNVEVLASLTPNKAREVVERALWQGFKLGRGIRITLPPKYMNLTENDVITFTHEGEAYKAILSSVSVGFNGIVEVQGAIIDQETFTGEGQSSLFKRSQVLFEGSYDLEVPAIPPFRERDSGRFGTYFALITTDPDTAFLSPAVFISEFPNQGFRSESRILPRQATHGFGLTILEELDIGYWHLDATFDVELDSGTLSSVADVHEVYAGKNWATYQYEGVSYIFAFQEAEPLGGNSWRLKKLLFGLRRSSSKAQSVDESFLLLDDAVQFVEFNPEKLGTFLWTKVISDGFTLDDVTTKQVAVSDLSIRSWSPRTPWVERRESDGSIFVKWRAVTSNYVSIFSPKAQPFETLLYSISIRKNREEVRVVDQAGGSALAEEYEYTPSQQTTDGLTAGDEVEFTIDYGSTLFEPNAKEVKRASTSPFLPDDNKVTITY